MILKRIILVTFRQLMLLLNIVMKMVEEGYILVPIVLIEQE